MARGRSILAALIVAASARSAAAGIGDLPFVGEVRIFGYDFCPAGWQPADGRLLAIASSETLFNLIGTTYGGDGQETFAMPDLRGRLPIGTGQGAGLTPRALGETGGAETVTLTVAQLPAHAHAEAATTLPPTSAIPGGRLPAQPSRTPLYRTGAVHDTTRASDAIGAAGGSQPVDNVPPYTAFTICMAEYGVFPPQP